MHTITPYGHYLQCYLFFYSIVNKVVCLSYKHRVLIRQPLIFTRKHTFYYTSQNCSKVTLEKELCTKFIILSENFIIIIVLLNKYIIHLNVHVQICISPIVVAGSHLLYIIMPIMKPLYKSRNF